MNVYELIDDLYLAYSHWTAGDDNEWPYMPVRQMLDAYFALAPDWSRAPDDAKWYTIDVEGDCAWHDDEPMIHGHGWYSPHKYIVNGIDLPLGIDWRLCKWQRPEVAA